MASCSDDGTVRVLHARVYDDLMRQPLIVPVRTLKGHNKRQSEAGRSRHCLSSYAALDIFVRETGM